MPENSVPYPHIIAMQTYGTHRIKSPRTQQFISAFKLGYTTAVRDVLTHIYPDGVQDVTPTRASYHYVHFEKRITTRHGYLLFRFSDANVQQAELLTQGVLRPAIYRWLDEQWQEFPSASHRDGYAPLIGRDKPAFTPQGITIASLHEDDTSANVGIIVERVQRSAQDKPWWWFSGDTYPHKETLKQWGCRWSKKRRSWYFIGEHLPQALQDLVASQDEAQTISTPDTPAVPDIPDDDAPCSLQEAEQILGVTLSAGKSTDTKQSDTPTPPSSSNAQDDTEEKPAIRVIAPEALPEHLQVALTDIRNKPTVAPAKAVSTGKYLTIEQNYCGELSGDITGNVHCFGYAIHEETLVYLNLGGPKMACEAIRAKLSKGQSVNLHFEDAPSLELTTGEGETGKLGAFVQNISEARYTSMILVHEMMTEPNYGGKSTTFIFRTSHEQAIAQLKQHITALVNIPIFEAWSEYLWLAGQAALLIRKTRAGGGVDLWTVELDVDAWTRLITGGLEMGVLSFPEMAIAQVN
jgi:hypothetical protein